MNETRNPYQPPASPLEVASSAYLPCSENKFSRNARYCGWSCFSVVIIGSSLKIPLLIALACIPGILSICFVVTAKISTRRPENRNSHVKGSAWVLAILAFIFTCVLVAAATSGYISYGNRMHQHLTQSHHYFLKSTDQPQYFSLG